MYNVLANDLVKMLQEIYVKQKNQIKINIRGEMSLLVFISKYEDVFDITPGDLSESLNLSTARVAASLNSLENKGFIERKIDKDDRRKILITLTNKGREVSSKYKQEHLMEIELILRMFGEKDAKEILRLVSKLKTILEKANEERIGN